MTAISSIVAGFVVIGGAVALLRLAHRKAAEFREAMTSIRRESDVLEFERDPSTGVFRAKH